MAEPTVYLSFLSPLILQMVSLSMLANIQRLVVNFVSELSYIYLENELLGLFRCRSLGRHLECLFKPLIKHKKQL